jgi:hypothetical protein
MFEVLEPSPQGTIDVVDDDSKAVAGATLGFGTDRVLELVQSFLARPSCAPLKVISKEIKAFSRNGDIHQAGLFRMQSKASLCGQILKQPKSPTGFRLTPAQDHEIVRLADHLKSRLRHSHIDRMQVQIGKQGAYHGSLRAAFLRGPQGQVLHDILLEKCPDEFQHSPIRNVLTDVGQQWVVRNTVKVGFEVGVHHVRVTCLEKALHFTQSVLTSASRSESVTVRDEYILENRLDHNPQCSLDDSVPHTGNSQRALLLAAKLVNVGSTYRPRPIASRAQFFGKSRDLSRKILLEGFDPL